MKLVLCLISACAVLAGCASAGNTIVSGEYFYPGADGSAALARHWVIYLGRTS